MKKVFCILMFLFPIVVNAQQPWYKYSPLDYMWMNVGNEGFSGIEVNWISFTFSPTDGLPYIAYMGSLGKATVMKFDGNNWVYVGNAGFSADLAAYESLAFSPTNGQPYVAYMYYDWQNDYGASVMTFDGTSWVSVGAGFSVTEVLHVSLAFNPSNGQPYVAFQDVADYYKATVMKFDGTRWVDVGVEGFSAGKANYESLAFSPIDSLPYVAFEDYQGSDWYTGKASVMKFNGTDWVYLGNAGFSAGATLYTSLAFSPSDGEPYVAYEDVENHYGATVMKFDGTSWVNVGNAGFTAGWVAHTCLAFNPIDNMPYVAYGGDEDNQQNATVMKFNGENWVTVGNPDFSAGWAEYTSLAFSPSGQPYVAYQDFANNNEATVMKYDSVYSGINESQESRLLVYPNPATDKITIEIAEGQAPSQLSMMNLNGEEVLTCSLIKPKTQIDISNLPSGVYFMRLTNDKMVELGKFVKE